MPVKEENYDQYIESKSDILTYLDQLKYVLNQKSTKIAFQEDRFEDKNRNPQYTNRYAIAKLFPNDDKIEVLKRELQKLCVEEYIESVKDLNYPNRKDMRVFGRKYGNDEVYIKFRVEILPGTNIFVMSFHLSTVRFCNVCFPYK